MRSCGSLSVSEATSSDLRLDAGKNIFCPSFTERKASEAIGLGASRSNTANEICGEYNVRL